jgi:hypothetical protein
VLSTAPITAPSFDETVEICAIVAVVDIRVESCGREKPLRGECSCYLAKSSDNPRGRHLYEFVLQSYVTMTNMNKTKLVLLLVVLKYLLNVLIMNKNQAYNGN